MQQFSPRPIDSFVKRSQNILQKEYVVIGKRRISSFTAWAVIAFFVGLTIAIAFLASRSGTLEGSEAARAPRPVWSSWGNWQEGSAPVNTSTVQYRSRAQRSTQIVNGRRTRVSAQGYEERQCVKSCEGLAGAAAAAPTTYQASTDFSSSQGSPKPWYYLDGNGNQLTYNATNPNAGNAPAWQGNEQYLLVANNWQHPGQNADSVRRWIAPGSGAIRITGNVHDTNTDCGDGVVVTIKKNGAQLWNASIANGDTTGQNFDSSVSVASQDNIDFIVNKGSPNNYCDSTFFDPKIDFTPTGSSTLSVACAPKTITLPVNSLQKFTATPSGGAAPYTYTYSWSNSVTCGNGTTNQTQTCDLFFGAPLANFPIPITVTDSKGATASDSCTITITNTGSDTVTVSKTYFGITPFTPALLLDGRVPSAQTADTATWNNVTQGNHTITTTSASNTKSFYAVCPNSNSCGGKLYEGQNFTFNHASEQNDYMRFIYTDSGARLNDYEEGEGIFFSNGNILKNIFGGKNLDVAEDCAITFHVKDVPPGSKEFLWIKEAADSWKNLGINVGLTTEGAADLPTLEDIQTVSGPLNTIIKTNISNVSWLLKYGKGPGVSLLFGWILLEGTNAVIHALSGDIGIDNSIFTNRAETIRWVNHEMGHVFGFNETLTYSVMREFGSSPIFPTDEDARRLAYLYPNCVPDLSRLALTFNPDPADFLGPPESGATYCKNAPKSGRFRFKGTISYFDPIGPSTVTLDDVIKVRYHYYGVGYESQEFIVPYENLTKTASPLGFGKKTLNAGESTSAYLCQVPWSPERLGMLEITVSGKSSKGVHLSTTNTIYLGVVPP